MIPEPFPSHDGLITHAFGPLADDGTPSSNAPRLGRQEWNALIGIVTAIIGNVVISFALNLQRYAHIRLHRSELRRNRSWKSAKRRSGGGGRYAEADGIGAEDGNAADAGREADETAPLRKSSGSNASDDGADEKNDGEAARSYLESPYWWAGITLMVVGEAGNFLA